MIELNKAYCVAVNLTEVKAERYTTKDAPAKPLAKLSKTITEIKNKMLMSLTANQANRILLKAAMIAPTKRPRITPLCIE